MRHKFDSNPHSSAILAGLSKDAFELAKPSYWCVNGKPCKGYVDNHYRETPALYIRLILRLSAITKYICYRYFKHH
jgi:hypothetical protein